ncbi:unnamed protein product [Amoebophrya sp. A120]|nr:unnamed protein product [Amoebophrya sp. A120]|eukprot:GSA120T00010416001.1
MGNKQSKQKAPQEETATHKMPEISSYPQTIEPAAPRSSKAPVDPPVPTPSRNSQQQSESKPAPIDVTIIRKDGSKKVVRLNKGDQLKLKPGEKLAPGQSDKLKVESVSQGRRRQVSTAPQPQVQQQASRPVVVQQPQQPTTVVVQQPPPQVVYARPYPYGGYYGRPYGYGYGYPYGYYDPVPGAMVGGLALGLGMGLLL